MQYRPLGTTGMNVSSICLGTMTYGEQNTEAEAHGQMDYALAEGVNFFDTAELYAIPPKPETYGRTEEIIGSWFKKSGRRQDVILATKIAGPGIAHIRGGDARLDAANIKAAVDGSLKRLQTDYIDLYQIHWPLRPVNSFGKLGFDQAKVTGRESDAILETLEALQKEIAAGRVRHIGLSNETSWGLMTFLKHHAAKGMPRVQSVQNAYSLLNRTYEIGMAEMSMQESTGLLAYAPLGAGTLTGKYNDGQVPKGSRWDIDSRPSRYKKPRMESAVKSYMEVAKKYGLDHVQMAISFVKDRPFVTSAIIGATKMEQLKTNIAAAEVTLPVEVLRAIDDVHHMNPNPTP